MLRTVHLTGRLKKRFQGPFSLAADSMQEIVRALCANFPGFRKELAKGAYKIIVGNRLGGTVNTTLQGNPVPIIGGRMRTGSLVISAGIFTEKMTT